MPSSKPSTLLTDHTMTVPDSVKTAIATGSAHVTLRGGYGTGKLSANNAGDTLISGVTAELMRGARGRDTFVFNALNDDVATGGRGADRYVFTGVAETATRPLALAYPRNRTAATITNFNPRKGDKLVLTVNAFGPAVTQLAHRFKLVSGPHPQPHGPGATLLLNTRTHVLSFDADGSGLISDKVIAKLPHTNTIKPASVVIQA
jgi:Ca2+-binding RTX toxin-like protein